VWWYALERLLAAVDHITFEHAGHVYAYRTVTRAQKIRAYRSVHALLLKTHPPAVDQLLVQLFEGQSCELRGLANDDLLTPEQVCMLSRDPLVTIGAHTVSHPVLRTLTDEDSRREIHTCRDRLEAVTGKPVRHFAYPFGNRVAVGSREERFVRESGYATATTTRARQLMSTDRPTALPRIMLSSEFDAVATLRVLLTGWFGGRS
jgi:peptidoglycan/xylan/chitin deacetylase (PgdA/CDA1 family)